MTRLRTLSTAVAWTSWARAPFDRAREENKPVLLSIAAEWCGTCREMDRGVYGDPAIATTINERFVPIRVDADQRPDISERYSLGGWPTTVFLTPDGDILGGGTYVPAERMPSVLDQVAAVFSRNPHGGTVGPTPANAAFRDPAVDGAAPDIDALTTLVLDTFDPEHGGFGAAPKFPLVAPVRLALSLWSETRDPRVETILTSSLDAMGWGGIYDEGNGGFFRYAASRDWTHAHTEKLLDSNAALLRLYLDAGAVLEVSRYTERGADVLRYIQTWLADPVDGGWFASQEAADDYYATPPEPRANSSAPAVSALQFADGNAAMASAALHAAAVFGDDGLRDFALKSLERVLLACYKPGDGVAHFHSERGRVRGLLTDQVAMADACLDAHALSGNIVYEMMAEELMHFAARTMWDPEAGGFNDRAADAESDVGLLRTPLKPFVANCDAAQVLRRLAATSGEHDFARLADETLQAIAPRAAAHGPLAAHYALAVRQPQSR